MGSVVTFCIEDEVLQGLQTHSGDDLICICNDASEFAALVKTLDAKKSNLEAVVLGSRFAEPLQMAQRIYALDRTIAVVVISSERDVARFEQALRFSLFVADQTVCVCENDLSGILKAVADGLKKTRSRRKHKRLMLQLNDSLAQNAVQAQSPESLVHIDKLLDFAPVGVAILNLDGKVVAWNRRAATITGVSEREILAKKFDRVFELVLPGNKALKELFAQTHADSQTVDFEGSRREHEALKFFEFSLGSLGEASKKSMMVVFYDITSRKQTELDIRLAIDQAQAANEAKSRFLANMSHEIRTPIGAILGFLELMKEPDAKPSELKDYIATIDRNGNQLLALIDDILDLAKVEAGRISVITTRVAFMELLADITSLMRFRAREKGLDFKVTFESDMPNYVEIDGVRLRQILSNVLGNAIKFTEFGSVELTARFQNAILIMRVKDTGIGLTSEQESKLFTPFMQADPSISRKFGGTGLGLSLSKKLAMLLGGDLVLLESQPGRGSVFEIRVSVGIPDNAVFSASSAIEHKPVANVALRQEKAKELLGAKILLVEDSPDNRFLISRLLSAEGANVDFANDGDEGVKRALASTYHVVVMDMQMPVCDGLEATRRLRSSGYDRPIVALTAHAMDEEKRKAFAAGCTDYLTKPVNKLKLISVLSRYCDE